MWATYKWNKEIVQILLENWADVNIRNEIWDIATDIAKNEWYEEFFNILSK